MGVVGNAARAGQRHGAVFDGQGHCVHRIATQGHFQGSFFMLFYYCLVCDLTVVFLPVLKGDGDRGLGGAVWSV